VSTLNNETDVLKELFKKGVGKQTDYMAVAIELQSQQIAYVHLQAQYRTDLLLLNAICGIHDTSNVQLAPPELTVKTDYDRKSSPFFYKFTLESLSFQNQQRVIDTRYRPHLNLFGDAGVNSARLAGIYQSVGFSVGLSFIVPLYDGGHRKLDYKKLDFSELTRQNYQAYFYNQHSLKLTQVHNELTANEQILVRLAQQLKDVDTMLKLTRQQLLNGVTSTIDYVLILRNYKEINNAFNQALIKKQLLISENNYWTW
jgi:outer membrane protein TolC